MAVTSQMEAQLRARIAELEAQAAQKGVAPKLTFKVGAKGGVSVYGLGRYPMTAYMSQWLRLLDPKIVAELLAFIKANEQALAVKKA